MYRKIENASKYSIQRLLEIIKAGIVSMLTDYSKLYSDEETSLLKDVVKAIEEEINKVETNNIDYLQISTILKYEESLKKLAFRCWQLEIENDNQFISWYKNDKLGEISPVLSTTFGDGDSFCDSRYGVSFDVNVDSFLGACNKDAATLIESSDKESIYTIGKTSDGKIINSYNLATPIITPKQVFDKSDNTYMSKHNEIILDATKTRPQSVIYSDENDLKMVNLISQKFNIPIEYKKNSYTK